ncbi:hypothetical protein CO054_00170 [Candidatus Shapirobacteria bacterium CG_4_9_14_0_2_um_filter_39_11]|uniref:Major facilitator superfamily (MFS) profile domain-containing protein n=1 Tax=Candidatus Shapirobacteria bacterium CG_4_9_14_0_2_um_filter_39_11 TaxID=1974478 RepID=A0A2M8ETK5_9BACT|nr:MAG: hypothetical protein CO054_00170 [Candidatus Shapirobacteria bacterium CG_4_9_14_0_2_um_filter_39_11]
MAEQNQKSKPSQEALIQLLDEQAKTQHSKNAIFFFFVFGVIFFLVKGQSLFSLGTLLFFVVGMFLASILSIPGYLIKVFISKKINERQATILSSFYWLFEIAYDFVVTYILFTIYLRLVG